ncbi:ER membrane complex subunit 3 [Serendipita sp. 396]|nr:ER membrane complex subunit 3 [Serendipita sp. 396]KAG8789466.1 ER membrane complex subunit 3 [Serendipita sp. 397]KAG8804697.1 ER membrane complex subunit 3 [Serendipita sp. 398]KAG8879052.1 ER membrane complex subunit 3 [Serendipita sp. 405]
MSGESLYLDPQIRDWVLFPITLVMILVGILRNNVTQLLVSSPKKSTRSATREQRALLRAQILRANAKSSPLPPSYYTAHTDDLIAAFAAGRYLKEDPSRPNEVDEHGNRIAPAPGNMLTDPSMMEGMMGGMKNQAVMMVPQMVIMGWINFFFQGFVLIKLPFPLTLGFKSMMQRGIETPDMDVRWVSSLSWYFLNWFGLNGLYRLLLGDGNAATDQKDLATSPFAGAGAPVMNQPQDYNKLFASESENLQLAQGLYSWIGDDVDSRILRRYGKLPVA